MYLDNNLVGNGSFQSFTSCSDYSYAILPITFGSHQIRSDSGFVAYAYGYGFAESYIYSVGASFKNIQYGFTTTKTCLQDTIYFTSFGEDIIDYEWDFGDGSPVQTDSIAAHFYASSGDYDVKMIVTRSGSCAKDTIVKRIKIDSIPVFSTDVVDPTCSNSQDGLGLIPTICKPQKAVIPLLL